MFDELRGLSHHFLKIKNSPYKRYLIQTTKFTHRMSMILGQRGVGKTTTLVQVLLEYVKGDRFDQRVLYIQADHFQMGTTSLYEVAEQFQALGGKLIAFDEIHKYPNWSKELKSIYDTFPTLKILVSGSSALEIYRGSHDLTRRVASYRMQGLSFREYLELTHDIEVPAYPLEEICEKHEKIEDLILEELEKKNQKILLEFNKYIRTGYYPYYHEIMNEAVYKMTLEQNLHTIIESDLAAIYPQLTGISINKIKKLLIFIANSVPFTPNWNKIKTTLEIGDLRTLKSYFKHLEDAGLIKTITKATQKFSQLVSPAKVYLDNTNQLFAISSGTPEKGTIRETYFLNMLSQKHSVKLPQNGDFLVDDFYLFEVGGRKKSFQQVKSHKNSYIACDGIERGIGARIPLWLFGFLY